MSNYLDGIEELLEANDAKEIEQIQSLWSGYGKIVRVGLKNHQYQSVVAKHIVFPNQTNHPRGWNTNLSHQRKVKSYQVEMDWYQNWANQCDDSCKIPNCYGVKRIGEELLICLEDLDVNGYSVRKSHLKISEVKLCLNWLANFHAKFLNQKPKGLWEIGTYWHLDTRPDEFELMKDCPLKQAATKIDKVLNDCKFKTIIHGDAKVANFCFNDIEKEVSAVDFQYVGGGCGMKDVAYFLGSCLTEVECETHEKELLGYYFSELENALNKLFIDINFSELRSEWSVLYVLAWADFTRFLMGWMPTHQKLNGYSEKQVIKALELIR